MRVCVCVTKTGNDRGRNGLLLDKTKSPITLLTVLFFRCDDFQKLIFSKFRIARSQRDGENRDGVSRARK